MATLALSELMRLEMIKEYKPLVEQSQGLVSQHENTILVLDKPIILTKSK
jgi:methionine aminopeptidase